MPAQQPDRSVADAIDRVLEAEQTATAAITTAEELARASLEAARDARRRILERARQRITRLHERAELRLSARLAQLEATRPTPALAEAGLRLVAQEALAMVAARLTTDATT